MNNLKRKEKIMKKMKISMMISAVAIATTMMGCGNNTETKQEKISLSGAGATFPEPFYAMAFESYQEKTGNTISYGGIGSGGGIRNLKDKTVDFAGSDAFLSDEEMSEMKPVIHIPTCMGAVVLAYNIPELSDLRLSGDVVADIYAGKITMWNDIRIAAMNPLAKLPKKRIIPVYRSDGSGTTFVFTNYLSQVNKNWKENYGAGKSVDFKEGQAAKGNPGVAGVVGQTPYSIGYIGSEYAFAQKLQMAQMVNANGQFVEPTVESISAAAKGDLPQDTRTMITNSNADRAYPISCFTWIVVYKEQNYAGRSEAQARATLDLLKHMLSPTTQQVTSLVNYAPLPKSAVKASLENLKQLTYNGVPLMN